METIKDKINKKLEKRINMVLLSISGGVVFALILNTIL
jgi:hypothetical protein